MRCPNCTETGTPHTVSQQKEQRTQIPVSVFWDTDDVEHVHDSNTYSVPYTCSNGHAWTIITPTTPCPASSAYAALVGEPALASPCTWTGPNSG